MDTSTADVHPFRADVVGTQGCGVVQMADLESAREAQEVLNGSMLQGSYIVVQPDARAAPEYAEKLRAGPPDWPPPPPRVERRHREMSGLGPGRAAPGRRERAAKRVSSASRLSLPRTV